MIDAADKRYFQTGVDPHQIDTRLTEVLVDLMATKAPHGATAVELAEDLIYAELANSILMDQIANFPPTDVGLVRAELLDLERLGIVYRTGRTRGTRWHVG